MSAPMGYGSRTNNQRDIQPVAIQSVNLDTRVAVVITRIKTTIQVDCSFSTGDTTVVPAVGEQWYVERFDGVWRLYGRIPFNDPTLTFEAREGQVGVGSGRGPVVLHGQTGGVQVVGDLVLGDDHYRSQGGQFQKQLGDGSWVPVVPSFGADVLSTDISDSTAVGRAVLTAANGAAARSAIGAGDYTKPGTGIPVTDLAAAVQTSLTLANTALQNVGANNIFDATSLGKQLLTAVDTDAARFILNIGTGTSVSAADIVDSTPVGRDVLKASTQTVARAAIGIDDATFTNTRTPTDNTVSTVKIVDGAVTAAKIAPDVVALINAPKPYDISFPVTFGQRAVGLGLNQIGVKLQHAVTFTKITYRCQTADATGTSSTFEIRKNGVAVPSSSISLVSSDQVAGGSVTGTFTFAEGDILTVAITAVGTTPGVGLVVDLKGTS